MTELTKKQKSDLCMQCHECCKALHFRINKADLVLEFYEARGLDCYEYGNLIYVEVPSVCPNLTAFGCRIYPQRPRACREADPRRHPVMGKRCLWNEENRKGTVA